MTGQLEVLTQLAVLLERVLLEWLVDLPPFCRYPPPQEIQVYYCKGLSKNWFPFIIGLIKPLFLEGFFTSDFTLKALSNPYSPLVAVIIFPGPIVVDFNRHLGFNLFGRRLQLSVLGFETTMKRLILGPFLYGFSGVVGGSFLA